MQPSYALLPASSYPKTVVGMCYAVIELTPIGLKWPLVTSQSWSGKLDMLSQHAKCGQAIPAYIHLITGQGS